MRRINTVILKVSPGFSKINFVLIISLCILIGLGLYLIYFYNKVNFQNTVDDMVSFIRYGHEYAVTHWKNIPLEILQDKDSLILILDKDGKKIPKEFKLPKGYDIESDVSKVIMEYSGDFYFPDGGTPAQNEKLKAWIKIKDVRKDKQKMIELWGFGGNIKY